MEKPEAFRTSARGNALGKWIMAQSNSHKFGQIIGEVLEAGIEPLLQDFADRNGLFLDKKGARAVRKGRKLTFVDKLENAHDLDFVLERDGSGDVQGKPVAFIEIAWRRYTKHSRNKVQEIQGAILPLIEVYSELHPFPGVILAGMFTAASLTQLRSNGFTVAYFPYESVVEAFRSVGIDSRFDEDTEEKEYARKVRAWSKLPRQQKESVINNLIRLNASEVTTFLASLSASISRSVESIRVVALHGAAFDLGSISEAISLVKTYALSKNILELYKFEITIKFNNGDVIRGEFTDKDGALQFLGTYSL